MPESSTIDETVSSNDTESAIREKNNDRTTKTRHRLDWAKRFKFHHPNVHTADPTILQNPPQGPPPEPPKQDPAIPPGPDNPPHEFIQDMSVNPIVPKTADVKTDSSVMQNVQPKSPEQIAQKRTSEFALRLLAGLAVQLAVKSREPHRQNALVRKAEQGYMSRLWDSYTKRALRVS